LIVPTQKDGESRETIHIKSDYRDDIVLTSEHAHLHQIMKPFGLDSCKPALFHLPIRSNDTYSRWHGGIHAGHFFDMNSNLPTPDTSEKLPFPRPAGGRFVALKRDTSIFYLALWSL
jgi:hypothetical protein